MSPLNNPKSWLWLQQKGWRAVTYFMNDFKLSRLNCGLHWDEDKIFKGPRTRLEKAVFLLLLSGCQRLACFGQVCNTAVIKETQIQRIHVEGLRKPSEHLLPLFTQIQELLPNLWRRSTTQGPHSYSSTQAVDQSYLLIPPKNKL